MIVPESQDKMVQTLQMKFTSHVFGIESQCFFEHLRGSLPFLQSNHHHAQIM